MTQPLFNHLHDIAAQVTAAPHVFLFFDFDGTLAPIVNDPRMANMPPTTRTALINLAATDKFSLGIISGRALPDLQQRVALEDVVYAGNHGLEISGPGLHLVETTATLRTEPLQALTRDLTTRLAHIPGVEVENKVLTASVHYRRAPTASIDEIRRIVRAAVESVSLFQVTPGLQVLEINPRVNWNKGSAVLWIQERLGKSSALSVFVGDDHTDEDAFAALPDGITVRVGLGGKTSARYHLADQASVQDLLIWFNTVTAFSSGTSKCGTHR